MTDHESSQSSRDLCRFPPSLESVDPWAVIEHVEAFANSPEGQEAIAALDDDEDVI